MSLPFSASPPRPCILRRIERVLGGPGIHRAVPREPRHWCPAPFSERRWGDARQKGEFPPFVGSFCILRGRFHRFSLPQPARIYLLEGLGWNIASCWHGFSLDLYVSCGCSRSFLLSNWMFLSAPTRVDVLICSYLSNWKFPSAPMRPAGLRCVFEALHPTPLVVLAGRSPKASFGPLSYCWVVCVGAFAVGLVASRGKSRRGVPLLGAAACPGRLPMWTEGCAGGGVPKPC